MKSYFKDRARKHLERIEKERNPAPPPVVTKEVDVSSFNKNIREAKGVEARTPQPQVPSATGSLVLPNGNRLPDGQQPGSLFWHRGEQQLYVMGDNGWSVLSGAAVQSSGELFVPLGQLELNEWDRKHLQAYFGNDVDYESVGVRLLMDGNQVPNGSEGQLVWMYPQSGGIQSGALLMRDATDTFTRIGTGGYSESIADRFIQASNPVFPDRVQLDDVLFATPRGDELLTRAIGPNWKKATVKRLTEGEHQNCLTVEGQVFWLHDERNLEKGRLIVETGEGPRGLLDLAENLPRDWEIAGNYLDGSGVPDGLDSISYAPPIAPPVEALPEVVGEPLIDPTAMDECSERKLPSAPVSQPSVPTLAGGNAITTLVGRLLMPENALARSLIGAGGTAVKMVAVQQFVHIGRDVIQWAADTVVESGYLSQGSYFGRTKIGKWAAKRHLRKLMSNPVYRVFEPVFTKGIVMLAVAVAKRAGIPIPEKAELFINDVADTAVMLQVAQLVTETGGPAIRGFIEGITSLASLAGQENGQITEGATT